MQADQGGFQPRLLVIDDAPDQAEALTDLAQDLGYLTRACVDPRQAMLQVSTFEPHAIILDVMMPGIDGITLLPMILKTLPGVRVLVLSGHGEAVLERARAATGEHSSRSVSVAEKPVSAARLRLFLGG